MWHCNGMVKAMEEIRRGGRSSLAVLDDSIQNKLVEQREQYLL